MSGDTPISSFVLRCSSSLRRTSQNALRGWVAFAYPPACALCRKPLEEPAILCPDCLRALPALPSHRCIRCSAALDDAWLDLCLTCGTQKVVVPKIFSLGPYHGTWGRLVCMLKFESEMAVGRWLGSRMADLLDIEASQYLDAVSYVPMTPRDRRRRGFNPAERLARVVARRMNLPMARLLSKQRHTQLQRSLPAAARGSNVAGAFEPISRRGMPRHVLLVDDVYTTGATVEACGRALLRGGATSVIAVTAARS